MLSRQKAVVGMEMVVAAARNMLPTLRNGREHKTLHKLLPHVDHAQYHKSSTKGKPK